MEGKRLVADPTRFSRCNLLRQAWKPVHFQRNPFYVSGFVYFELLRELAIDNRASHSSQQVGGAWRPAHLLALAHACIEYLVHGGLRHGLG
jgi:hypothetical protein